MTSLQSWLTKPRATVRIDTSLPSAPWAAWIKALRRPFAARQAADRPRIEVFDRLSLGGKKSLLLVSIEGQRLLIGVGEDAAPSVSSLDVPHPAHLRTPAPPTRTRSRRRMVRR